MKAMIILACHQTIKMKEGEMGKVYGTHMKREWWLL